jgi:CHASE2 domain-containing sensor protein
VVVNKMDLVGFSAERFAAIRQLYRDYLDRLGFNDNFPVDNLVEKTTPKVRRSVLIGRAETGQQLDAFPFRVAGFHLARQGIEIKPPTAAAQTSNNDAEKFYAHGTIGWSEG